MEIVYGENSHLKGRLHKKIAEKTLYYNGNLEKVYFIEDIIYSTVLKYNEEKAQEQFCSIASLNNERFIVSLYNDISEQNPNGESSLEYSTKDFTTAEIQEYIGTIIKGFGVADENVIFVKSENGMFTFENIIEETIELNAEEIDVEIVISNYKKFYKTYLLGFIIILFSIGSFFGISELTNFIKKEEKSLKNQIVKLKRNGKTLQKQIDKERVKFIKVQGKKHLFEEKNFKLLEERIVKLKISEQEKVDSIRKKATKR